MLKFHPMHCLCLKISPMSQSISTASRHHTCPMALPANGASSLKTNQVSSSYDREDTTCNMSRPVKDGKVSIVSGVSFSLFPSSFMPDFKKNGKLTEIEEAGNVAGLNYSFRPVDDLVVYVSSAVKLDDRQIDLIDRKMQRLTGFRKLRLENDVDPSLIAGFVINYCDNGSQVIDLSVRGKLDALAARLESSDKKSSSIVGDFLACMQHQVMNYSM